MGFMDRVFGKKQPKSDDLTAKIVEQDRHRADAETTIRNAVEARSAALDAGDVEALAAVDTSVVNARHVIEVADHAIAQLQTALTTRLDVEARESFRRDVTAANEQAEALRARIEGEYVEAATRLASLFADLDAHAAQRNALTARAQVLREPVSLDSPEEFRRNPVRWSATWPDPNDLPPVLSHLLSIRDEHGRWSNTDPYWTPRRLTGPVEDAPRGTIKWIDGKPVSVDENVIIEGSRGGEIPNALHGAFHLPGLRFGDNPFWPRKG